MAYSLLTADVQRGLQFAFSPDFSKLNAQVILAAIGQAFYATGVGQAMMIAYGAYIPAGTSLVRTVIRHLRFHPAGLAACNADRFSAGVCLWHESGARLPAGV